MQSTTPLFSKAIFYNNIKRFWPIFIAYILLILTLSLGIVVNGNFEKLIIPGEFINYVYDLSELFSLAIALFSIVAAAAVFSYIHNSQATAMVNTLPYKRKTVFFSNYLSGLFMLLIPLLLFFLILSGIGLSYNILDFLGLLKWLFIFVSLSILLYSVAVIIGMLTGNIIAHIAFFGVANIFFKGLEELVGYFLRHFLYGFTNSFSAIKDFVEIATPVLYTSSAQHNTNLQENWGVWAGYILAGIILTWLSLELYKKRKMENAGDVIAIRKLNPIFKYGITLCSSLTLGIILIQMFNIGANNLLLSVGFIIFAGMIGYFVAEMLLHKSYRVFHTYKGFIIYALLLTLVSISVYNDWYGYATRLPDADKIEAIAFSDSWLSYNATNNLLAENSIVYFNDIPNIPDSLALTYGVPIAKEKRPNSNGYRYIYGDIKNLTKEETKLLWSVIPGIYQENQSIASILELHENLTQNIKTVRTNYRIRSSLRGYDREESQFFSINIIYKLENGKIQTHNFPIIIPKQKPDRTDETILNDLATIAGLEENRIKKIAAIDFAPEYIQNISVNMEIIDKFKNLDPDLTPLTRENDQTVENIQNIVIKEEHHKAFVEAIKSDYLTMSNKEMLNSSHNSNRCGYIRISVNNLHLPPDNKFRERRSTIDLSIFHKNTIKFLRDNGYINEEIYDYIQEYNKLAEKKEKPSQRVSLA